ncbi:MAG: 2,4-dihydroxyhept-2-ene-1,7-dioic acid aldolase [SAR86 cluster bacterium]|nr:2,4-dihydroxyhept-2-ene-1,7-dioic acid aldolase [SAR86 cluster bacterium]
MKKNRFNNANVGFFLTIPDEIVCEIFCNLSYDFCVIDLEHSVIDLKKCQNFIRICNLKGIECLVRLSCDSDVEIKKVLDMGADGIIVPMVKSLSQANEIVKNVFYPPKGRRGMGLARAQMYGENFEKNLKKSRKIKLIVQFEHIDVLNCYEDILSIEEVSGFMIGPYDFTASMGLAGEFENPIFLKHIKDIEEANKKFKKIQGFHLIEPDKEKFRQLLSKNYDFIVYSLDTKHLQISGASIFDE